ncbi:MAG: amidohydrolase family protein, partial [Methanoregulaceae archaeon]|nr:amidohydrolase family protein [Methanoregulaceae archaeon]
MVADCVVRGLALLSDSFEGRQVRIEVEGGRIRSIREVSGEPDFLICPAFFNSHTHLGDSVAMDIAATGDLADLVTPPGGLKHRILASTPRPVQVAGMAASVRDMVRGGTAGFADFREGGPDGVAALREAVRRAPVRSVIFGREEGELVADGLGVSSARDVPDLFDAVSNARKYGKLIAFHAGERDPDDVDSAISFDPDLLIHLTHATDRQLREVADRDIPVVICPRANWAFGVASSPEHPPVRRLLELGCRVFLGTDNVMIAKPDMLQEMGFAAFLYRLQPRDL